MRAWDVSVEWCQEVLPTMVSFTQGVGVGRGAAQAASLYPCLGFYYLFPQEDGGPTFLATCLLQRTLSVGSHWPSRIIISNESPFS